MESPAIGVLRTPSWERFAPTPCWRPKAKNSLGRPASGMHSASQDRGLSRLPGRLLSTRTSGDARGTCCCRIDISSSIGYPYVHLMLVKNCEKEQQSDGSAQVHSSVGRSLIAIASGWAVAFAGGIATMLIIAISHPEGFTSREAARSTGSLLVSLLAFVPWSAIGGFVTGRIAQRNEIKHGIGLILFTLAVYAGFRLLRGHESDAIQTPIWFHVASEVLQVPSVLFGAWLQMRRRTLPQKAPTGVAGAANDLWLSVLIVVERFRFSIAVVLSVGIVLGGASAGTLLMGIGLLGLRDLLGLDQVSPAVQILCVAISFSLSCVLARRAFRRIVRTEASLPKIVE